MKSKLLMAALPLATSESTSPFVAKKRKNGGTHRTIVSSSPVRELSPLLVRTTYYVLRRMTKARRQLGSTERQIETIGEDRPTASKTKAALFKRSLPLFWKKRTIEWEMEEEERRRTGSLIWNVASGLVLDTKTRLDEKVWDSGGTR